MPEPLNPETPLSSAWRSSLTSTQSSTCANVGNAEALPRQLRSRSQPADQHERSTRHPATPGCDYQLRRLHHGTQPRRSRAASAARKPIASGNDLSSTQRAGPAPASRPARRARRAVLDADNDARRTRSRNRRSSSAAEYSAPTGADSPAGWDGRSVLEAVGFREAEVVPARPRLPFVVQPAQWVVASRGGRVPC